jgi:ParB/RepB/Spo0J family partition protein
MNAPEAIPAAALLPLDTIYQSPTNPRKHFDAAKLDELAISIKEHGVLQPILVRAWQVGMANPTHRPMVEMMSTYEIVCGERRWRASQIAGMATIPAIVRELTDKEVLEMQVVENLQREDVHPLEEAEGYERLMKYHGYTADTLGDKVGKSRAYIYARIKLLALVPAARELFYDSKLTASTALLIARVPGATLQMKAATEITKPDWQKEVMSARRAAEHIQQNYMLDLDEATFKTADAELVKKAGSCDACPKRSGNDLLLAADVGSPNVCTDPPCFQDKKNANFLRLKALAEQSGKEVVTGKAAADMTYNGDFSLRAHNLARLDAVCHDDKDRRTYAEILGKAAPAVTLVEDPKKKVFIEAVDTRQLEIALKKAGIGKPTGKTDRADKNHQRDQSERDAKAKAENTWRGTLFQAIRLKLGERFASGTFTADDLRPIVMAMYSQQLGNGDYSAEELMTVWSFTVPEDTDIDDCQPALIDFFNTLDMPALWLFLADMVLINDSKVMPWAFNNDQTPTPRLLLAQAARLDIDAEALRNPPPEPVKVQPKTAKTKATKPAPTPSNAAHAGEVDATAAPAEPAKPALKADAKKARAKANPAPALPANEAAAPPKSTPMPAWPFPSGARA